MRDSFVFALACQILVIRYILAKGRLAEDGKLNYTQLSYKYGHKAREYQVQTDDGYVLKLFQIPGHKALPVLLMHGMADSSDMWVIRGRTSLAITLANQGYDVWTGNVRGNRYSRSHVYLNPDTSEEFWDFSVHEHGYYDLASIIDTVLIETGTQKLNAIGYSQGNTIFYVLGSTRPEYNAKVNVLIALAPVAFLNNALPPLRRIIEHSPALFEMMKKIHINEVCGDFSLLNVALKTLCPEPIVGYLVCMHGLFFPFSGTDVEEVEPDFVRIYFGHFPTSTSRKNLYHFGQIGLSRQFAQYDYGTNGNFEKYHSNSPPKYNLSSVTIKVALFVGANDRISTVKDADLLGQKLPNVVKHMTMPRRKMNHLDFVIGRHMNDYLFPYIFEVLRKYSIE